MGFEAYVASSRPGLVGIEHTSLSVLDFSTTEYVAHVEWRASVFLLIGAGLVALVFSVYTISRAARAHPLPVGVIAGIAVAFASLVYSLIDQENPVSFLAQLVGLLESESQRLANADLRTLAFLPRRAAELSAIAIGVAAASVVVLPRTVEARELARRVRTLRVLLYVSAGLFVAGIIETEKTFAWLVTFLDPAGEEGSAVLHRIVSAGTFSTGAFYTLLIVSIYLPAAAALAYVGRRLAQQSIAPGEDAGEWLLSNGLAISWRGQLVRVVTLLTPLLSSVVAQSLSELT